MSRSIHRIAALSPLFLSASFWNQSSLTTSRLTRVTPEKPSSRAAAGVTSITRPRTKGPRFHADDGRFALSCGSPSQRSELAKSANSRSSSGLVMTRLSRTNSDFGTCLTSTQCDLMCAGTLHGPAKSVQNSDVSVLLSSRLFARLNREVHRNKRDHCQDDHVGRNRPGLRLELRHQPGGDQRRQSACEN